MLERGRGGVLPARSCSRARGSARARSSATSRSCASARGSARARVIGRGSAVDNDVLIGARVRVQTDVYLTAYSRGRGRRVRRPGRGDHQRLDDVAPRRRLRARGRAAAPRVPDRRRRRCSRRASRSARRRSWPRARSWCATCPPRAVVMGVPGARRARGRRRGPARALALGSPRMSERPGGGLTPGDPLGGERPPERRRVGRARGAGDAGLHEPGAARRGRARAGRGDAAGRSAAAPCSRAGGAASARS